jgi:ACS family hexuronate transporter-like MFS transporter
MASFSTSGAAPAGGAMPAGWRQYRWRILALLFLVTVINFVHRQTLSVVAPVLREQLHLTNTDYGRIVSAFMFGMMVGEFPVGWLMDRIGARNGFSFSVVWWSLAAAMHTFARTAFQFSAVRFWMGTGECGNFSGAMKVVSEWFPARERAFAVGVFNAGSMIGSLITPPLIVYITLNFGWRMAFLGPSILGFGWVILWRRMYRPLDRHAGVSEAEREYIRADLPQVGPPPANRELLRHAPAWGLILCRLLVGPVIQFYWFWMPAYLYQARGLSLTAIGMFTWIPYLFGDVGSVGGGWVAGFLMRRGVSLPAARLGTMWTGAACCALSVCVTLAPSAATAIGLISLVMLGHTALSANMFAAISDIFPEGAVGRFTGLTGIAGGVSGLLFPLLTGYLVDKLSFGPVFVIAGMLPAAGVLCLALLGGGFRRLSI